MPNHLIVSENDRKEFAQFIIYKAKNNEILKEMNVDYSYESGFNFPKIYDSDKIKNANADYIYQTYIKYHDSRQLRFEFDSNKNISGLRWKDSAITWTNEEVDELKKIINNPENVKGFEEWLKLDAGKRFELRLLN
jgi:hypothetical protein